MKPRPDMARGAFARVFPLVLALVLAAPGDASAKWRGIKAADSQIVFAGRDFDAYRAFFHYLPFVESGHRMEGYLATWMAPSRRVPVFWARLDILAPDYYFSDAGSRSIDEFPKLFAWFKTLKVSHGETGKAKTAMGEAEYREHIVDAIGEFLEEHLPVGGR